MDPETSECTKNNLDQYVLEKLILDFYTVVLRSGGKVALEGLK